MSATERFAMVPEAITFSPTLSDGAVRLYAALVQHADRKGRCRPGQGRLAVRLGWTMRRLQRHLAELVAAGVVQVFHRGRYGTANEYLLMTTPASPCDEAPMTTPASPCETPHDDKNVACMTTPASHQLDQLTRPVKLASFAEVWDRHRGALPPVGYRLSDGQRAAAQRVMAEPDLAERAVALFLADLRHAEARHGWGIFLEDSPAWLAKTSAEVHPAEMPESESIIAARDHEKWANENPEEAERDHQTALEQMAAVRGHLPRLSERPSLSVAFEANSR